MSYIVQICSVCHKRITDHYQWLGHQKLCGHKQFKREKSKMTDNDIKEAYFKARGWWEHESQYDGSYWWDKNGNSTHIPVLPDSLPNILEHYPDFKEHVLEVMLRDYYKLTVYGGSVTWRGAWDYQKEIEEIKDNNILHAAVIAATRYFEEKRDE